MYDLFKNLFSHKIFYLNKKWQTNVIIIILIILTRLKLFTGIYEFFILFRIFTILNKSIKL